jgi:hypothetical protein
MRLHPSSSAMGRRDRQKFDLARELGKHYEDIQAMNMQNLHSTDISVKQVALALYLIGTRMRPAYWGLWFEEFLYYAIGLISLIFF